MAETISCDYTAWNQTMIDYRQNLRKERMPNPSYVDPAEMIRRLSMKMEDDGIYVADVGQNQIWSCRYHVVKKGNFLTSGGMGTMGYAIPAAIGGKVAAPGRQCVAVCGDGSFQMSMMELATMKQHNIPVKVIVLKNGYLGMVREYQQYHYKDAYAMVDLSGSPDLEKIAEAYDMPFLRMTDMSQINETLDQFLSAPDSILLECVIDPLDLV
jgi:acetolactate synthase-1/2/3 large subunit